MPKIVEVKTYAFEELDEDAQNRIIERYRESLAQWGYHWHDEALNSIREFLRDVAQGAKLVNWKYNPWRFDFGLKIENRHFRGRKLKDIDPHRMPTGYCLDCTLYGTLYEVWKRTGDPKQGIKDAIYAAFKELVADWGYQLSDEAIKESLLDNGDVYFEDGTIFKH